MKGWTADAVAKLAMVKPSSPDQENGKQVILGVCPSKSNCYRIGNKGLFKTPALIKYEENFMWQCGQYRNANINTPFEFHVDVYYPSKRSDLDNALKIILDCLQRIKAIKNDNNCCKIIAQKFIDKDRPRIEFNIIRL